MSIRNKILFSMLLVVFLFIPANLFLLARYLDVKESFLIIIERTVPRLEALLTMKNLVMQINFFMSYDEKFSQSLSKKDREHLAVIKDEFLSILGELGEQQTIYQKYESSSADQNGRKLNQLRDTVVLAALDLFLAGERQKSLSEITVKKGFLQIKEKDLNDFINRILVQESTLLEEERERTIAASTALFNLLLILNGIIILITFGLSIFLANIISKPIIKLSDFAGKIDYDHLAPMLPIMTRDEIGELQSHLNEMVMKLDRAKTRLIETSRSAGVAEIATSILHNVGNVLNSVNTSVAMLSEAAQHSYVVQLPKLLSILEENQEHLDLYLKEDERGKLFIPYFKKLIEQLENEQLQMSEELNQLNNNLTHVNQVIDMQQSSGQASSQIKETIELEELIEDILLLYANRLRKASINVERQYGNISPIISVRTKIQQIIINLIKNAIDALILGEQQEKRLIIKVETTSPSLACITISDNGIGIQKDDLTRIFSFGFTTKKEGHGYGLHNCALLARELGGELRVQSKGSGQGSSFTLEIPY
ncbi:sensor histidine kinase [Legionella quinlivanii]|uniref:histidine kinase n=1 Tax=Legionella quinlivanii TaxID=45073 RepID=A0A0W0XLB5_9GAMM|nr:sensor histidine kinase [Legionella quinlivanii]KTD45469.1 sensor histidine kinase [Legionella quinlivanii]SEG32947.1 HAMP domain-containing protein [Legionella quinlivanii DSM 21216]STY10560.1 sensor histidine kinase [Legionella quinlivanii]